MSGASRRASLAWVAALALSLALPASGASAKVLRPTRFDDPVPDACRQHDCSLREAVIAANKSDAPDTIKLGKGHYRLSVPENPSDDAMGGDLDVFHTATIVGKGPAKTSVDAQGAFGVFTFLGFEDHALNGLTVTGGARDDGAGILIGPSKFTGSHLVIKDNHATADGGGIYTVGTSSKLVKSTVKGNSAARGGGIFMPAGFADTPGLAVLSSTISGNSATSGGGIYNDGTDEFDNTELATLGLSNSTVAGNHGTSEGGGILTTDGNTSSILYSTIAANVVDNNGPGGLTNNGGTVFFAGSVLAKNSASILLLSGQCSGSIAQGAANVVEGQYHCGLDETSNRFVDHALIGSLGANGGPTQTIPLKKHSPALRFGFECPKRDQRGVKRPTPKKCDSGAYERTPAKHR